VADEPSGNQTNNDPRDGVNEALSATEGKIPSAFDAHKTGGANNAGGGRDESHRPRRSFLSRLTVNEWLTFLVGAGSLVVSYMTYRNAADTSDIKGCDRHRPCHPNQTAGRFHA
jgi:hypothetical protein